MVRKFRKFRGGVREFHDPTDPQQRTQPTEGGPRNTGKHEAALPQPEGVNHERHQPHEKGGTRELPPLRHGRLADSACVLTQNRPPLPTRPHRHSNKGAVPAARRAARTVAPDNIRGSGPSAEFTPAGVAEPACHSISRNPIRAPATLKISKNARR